MNQKFSGWNKAAEFMCSFADNETIKLNPGQADSLRELAERLPKNGVIIADEVGMGKTRIAAAVARSVIEAGGRVAILVPPGLGYQWGDELQIAGVEVPSILRSLWQYLGAWEINDAPTPWFKESALIISHAFTNWRLGESSAPWRWALLPQIYAEWRKKTTNRRPNYSKDIPYDEWVKNAAESIVSAINDSAEDHPARKLIQQLYEETPWPGALTPAEYERNAQLRPWLERAVGLGLGIFDLVIIDEAHKSRRQDSMLSRSLSEVILKSSNARCLAMTATPIELDATQWTQIFERIGVDEAKIAEVTSVISDYVESVTNVRKFLRDKDARDKFKKSATTFKQALDNYLLRRDKRQDDAVIEFQKASGESHHAYRREQKIMIDTAQLSSEWKQAVCAAEALSFVTHQYDCSDTKRLRLTLGNGHGIASLLDQVHLDKQEDQKQTEADRDASNDTQQRPKLPEKKRLLRAEWWQNVMLRPFEKNHESVLFEHPAILAAVEKVEEICRQEEKVLVFGRFTRPLRALVQLLNAREMLRCLDAGRPWPQSKVHKKDWQAVLSAHQQLCKQKNLNQPARDLCKQDKLNRTRLNKALAEQYQALENQRSSIRKNLISRIEQGFSKNQPDRRVQVLFAVFKEDEEALSIVARAMQELVLDNMENPAPPDFAQAFIDLTAAASDRDEDNTDSDSDKELDEQEASGVWAEIIKTRLQEEYSRSEGKHARLMFGETAPATRRFLQLAFNRKQSRLKVLVAQSLVGREGLNLHKACRTVVLLHPEWNPGVVEQQIGRVDRIGSLWEEKLMQAIAGKQTNGELPRIEVCPVVFRGTYDEKNWQVLRDRWDDLRAQLHGIVISPRIAEKYPDAEEIIAEINDTAPDFSPSSSADRK